jgi:small subunit ribosomal protein S17
MAEEEQQEQQREPEAEQPAVEAPPEEAAPEQPAPEQPAAAGDAAPAEEGEPLTAKQRRKLERSRATEPARPHRSPEDRAGERAERRSSKAAQRSRWRRKRREKSRAAPTAQTPTAPEPHERGARKVRRGVVVSSKPDKTITVRIDAVRPHPLYGKVIRNTGTLHVHDEGNQANEGDVVRIVECRPLSRTKRWRLLEVVERAE